MKKDPSPGLRAPSPWCGGARDEEPAAERYRSLEKEFGSASEDREEGPELLLNRFIPGVLERGGHLGAEPGGEAGAEAVQRHAEGPLAQA
jgi:hypothetical protein